MIAALFLIGFYSLAVLLAAFFAGYETGFVSCNPIRVRHLAEREGQPNARRLLVYLDHPDQLLTVVLLGTNLALMMGTITITRYFGNGYWATLVATPTFLIFAEILPKSIFRIHPTRLSLRLLPGIRFFEALLAPVALPVNWFSRHVLRALQPAGRDDFRFLMRSLEDMRVLVDESADKGTIEPEEQEMIHSVMDLQTRLAKEVMVPRVDIQALPESATRSELVSLLKACGHTRIPVYRDTIDSIIGVVNAFDVLCDTHPERNEIRRFIQDILHVPDTMRLDDVLRVMRDSKQRTAIVTDEYGGTDGLITIEDILEEIFGEIHDEYDKAEPSVRKVGPQDYVVKARTPLEDAAEAMGFPIADDEVETVGGWLTHAAGRIPQKGEVITAGRFRVTVLDGTPRAVTTVRIEVLPEHPSHDAQIP